MKNRFASQTLFVTGFSVLLGLFVNWLNPNGIPLVMDESRYSTEQSDKLMQDFMNNPTDTTSKENTNLIQNPNLTEEGFVKPQNIKLDFTKLLHEKNALFIDGRTEEEYKLGHIPGAINIPYINFTSLPNEKKLEIMDKYNKDGIIVVYCGGGDCEVSIDLAYDIAKLGFTSVNIYLGGWKEWTENGLKEER
ncbi:MAG: rhodanese-like domain-containing protein [Ignavibacteriaceae bacterium]|jgi:Rhodanese-related sulfurtransferase|nr:MAG: rhodanese domain-containing protein [Chlorobi bacterium OLB4]MBW7854626.1 rhodanese-like domain-containing protein [Ignavibacteria bacterium]MEB2330539.1 rhodanese-like domain-containing protein [Ignavibacteriaceae bacterium]OQY78146.1 MAG: hypothetical protein B6D43_03270 [Ignavibacteriales bacterium UTCHB1]